MRELFDEVAGQSRLDPEEAVRRTTRGPRRKRFYTHAGVVEGPNGFAVTLDDKPVRTPSGEQKIDFSSLAAPVLGHFAEFDDLCTVDDRVEMQAHLLLLEKAVDVHEYPGTWHFFAEDDEPSEVAAEAAELAWERTVEFLRAHVGATADEVE